MDNFVFVIKDQGDECVIGVRQTEEEAIGSIYDWMAKQIASLEPEFNLRSDGLVYINIFPGKRKTFVKVYLKDGTLYPFTVIEIIRYNMRAPLKG